MNRQLILDTETTGLEPKEGHRIIEIACLEVVNRRITGNYFHQYINPERSIDRDAEEIHGLTNDFLKDKPTFPTILIEFLKYIQGAELIIHNAPFDIGFLNHELNLAKHQEGKISDYCTITDTLVLARRKHPGQHNSLDALCKRYHVDNSNRSLHGALIDTELLAKVYLNMTGGQAVLFQNDSEILAPEKKIISTITTEQSFSIPIIYATSEELQAHQKFLEDIRE